MYCSFRRGTGVALRVSGRIGGYGAPRHRRRAMRTRAMAGMPSATAGVAGWLGGVGRDRWVAGRAGLAPGTGNVGSARDGGAAAALRHTATVTGGRAWRRRAVPAQTATAGGQRRYDGGRGQCSGRRRADRAQRQTTGAIRDRAGQVCSRCWKGAVSTDSVSRRTQTQSDRGAA